MMMGMMAMTIVDCGSYNDLQLTLITGLQRQEHIQYPSGLEDRNIHVQWLPVSSQACTFHGTFLLFFICVLGLWSLNSVI